MLKLKNNVVTIITLLYSTLVFYVIINIVISIKYGYYNGIYEIVGIIFITLLGVSITVINKELKNIRIK